MLCLQFTNFQMHFPVFFMTHCAHQSTSLCSLFGMIVILSLSFSLFTFTFHFPNMQSLLFVWHDWHAFRFTFSSSSNFTLLFTFTSFSSLFTFKICILCSLFGMIAMLSLSFSVSCFTLKMCTLCSLFSMICTLSELPKGQCSLCLSINALSIQNEIKGTLKQNYILTHLSK